MRDLAVSRETASRLEIHLKLLETWSKTINLVGPRELEDYWRRHVLDSAQLVRLAPAARCWIDLGSGAGFPGLVIACLLAETPGAAVHLVESNAKKAAFLREAVRETGAPAKVLAVRIEDVDWAAQRYDVVTARALAPLKRLIEHAKPAMDRGAQGFFPKGADYDAELTAASGALGGAYKADVLESLSDPRGRIIRISAG
jgi:16S rRNA (guanine527-N7)-methyltransferase